MSNVREVACARWECFHCKGRVFQVFSDVRGRGVSFGSRIVLTGKEPLAGIVCDTCGEEYPRCPK